MCGTAPRLYWSQANCNYPSEKLLWRCCACLRFEAGEAAGTLHVGPDLPTNEAHQRAALTSGAPHGTLRFDLTQDARLLYRLIRRARRPVEAVG